MTWPGALYRMHVDERLPAWARQLDHAYDVVWATSWQTQVLKCVAEPLGLPAWLVLTKLTPARSRGPTTTCTTQPLRARCVTSASSTAIAWVLNRTRPRPPARRETVAPNGHVLLIRPRRLTGLTAQHIDQLLRFVDQLTGSASAEKRRASKAGEERGGDLAVAGAITAPGQLGRDRRPTGESLASIIQMARRGIPAA